MASTNMFALLGDENEDFSQEAAPKASATETKKAREVAKPKPAGSKPEAKSSAPAKGGKGQENGKGGKGGGKGRGGYSRDDAEDDSGYPARNSGKGRNDRGGKGRDGGKGGKGGYGGYGEGEEGRPRKREFDRRSGTGKGGEVKRGGAGKANWGSENDEINAAKEGGAEMEPREEPRELTEEEIAAAEAEAAEKEKEEREMTLEEYQKVLAEKREALKSFNKDTVSDRKVDEAEFGEFNKLEKGEEQDFYVGGEGVKKKGKAKKEKEEGQSTVETNFSHPRQEYTPRDTGKGKGAKGGKGARREAPKGKGGDRASFGGGKGGRGYSAPNIGDASAFPSLGA